MTSFKENIFFTSQNIINREKGNNCFQMFIKGYTLWVIAIVNRRRQLDVMLQTGVWVDRSNNCYLSAGKIRRNVSVSVKATQK